MGFIDGTITIEKTTLKNVYLSDGSVWKSNKFHHDRTLITALLQRESQIFNKSLEVKISKTQQAMLESIRKGDEQAEEIKSSIRERIKSLRSQLDEVNGLNDSFKPVIKKIAETYVVQPTAMNRRFICGKSYKDGQEKFVMVFWNYYADCSNGHGELEQWFKLNYDSSFRASSGGFYMSNGHNNCDSQKRNKFYLFGRSETFRDFQDEIEDIRAYEKAHNLEFIIGKTVYTKWCIPGDELSAFSNVQQVQE